MAPDESRQTCTVGSRVYSQVLTLHRLQSSDIPGGPGALDHVYSNISFAVATNELMISKNSKRLDTGMVYFLGDSD
jgi:hypothetical protein